VTGLGGGGEMSSWGGQTSRGSHSVGAACTENLIRHSRVEAQELGCLNDVDARKVQQSIGLWETSAFIKKSQEVMSVCEGSTTLSHGVPTKGISPRRVGALRWRGDLAGKAVHLEDSRGTSRVTVSIPAAAKLPGTICHRAVWNKKGGHREKVKGG